MTSTTERPAEEVDEAIAALLEELRALPQQEKIIGGSMRNTTDVIDHLERRTPEGLELAEAFLRVRDKVAARL